MKRMILISAVFAVIGLMVSTATAVPVTNGSTILKKAIPRPLWGDDDPTDGNGPDDLRDWMYLMEYILARMLPVLFIVGTIKALLAGEFPTSILMLIYAILAAIVTSKDDYKTLLDMLYDEFKDNEDWDGDGY